MTTSAPHTANCLRCGRKLTSAKSITNGMGRSCKAKVAAAAKTVDLSDYKPFQRDKAIEAIEQGAILPTSRKNRFTVVSSDGTATYRVAPQACSCKAGARGVRCYHTAAARLLAAS